MKGIPEKKLRLEWVDITKFWGILAIVWGHTLSSGDVHRYLYSFHVPLFFYTVGLVFTGSELSFWHFTAKKAKALLIPYFTFAIISILIFSVFGSNILNNVSEKMLRHKNNVKKLWIFYRGFTSCFK